MGEERPGFKAETEQKHTAPDGNALAWCKLVLARRANDFRAFLNRLEWPAKEPRWLRWTGVALGGLAGVSLIGLVVIFLGMAAIAPTIPPGVDLYSLNRPQALTFTDQKRTVIGIRGAIVGERLKLSDMPLYLPAAFLAMEDRLFYRHRGVDPRGLMRAAMVDLKAGHIVQGGSTITQQVVKIVLLSPDRTFSRKLQEIGGAFAMENKLTKNQILELYLNRLYLGSGAYGVDGAAQTYFGKSARTVTLSEAAMLAALTRAPSAFSPRRDLEAAQSRAGRVLAAMVANGALTAAQAAEARANPATVIDPTENLSRDYFLDAAAEEAKQQVRFAASDLTITTTMDPALQEAARAEIVGVLNRRGSVTAHATQAAFVAMTPDGAVRAMVGGKDYAESSFNRVTKAHRQPGSAFKPFVYLAALEHGLTPSTVRVDEPITIKNWSPDNYSETHVGPVTLQDAFARSINTVAVELAQEVGLPNVVSVAHRLGIDSPLQPVASLALGTSEVTPLELTAAYASFATLGNRVRPYSVLKVRSPKGDVLYRRGMGAVSGRAFAENDGLQMNSMMYQVVQSGTGRAAAVPGHEVAGKTGTSADYRDAWFVGFSPELVVGVWVGNDDFTPMKKITGGTLPAQIWSGFMRTALKNSKPVPLPRAEPAAPYIADAASQQESGEGLIQRGLDGIGSFFNNLFGGSDAKAAPLPQTRKDKTSSAGDIYPDELDNRYAMDPGADRMPVFVPMTPATQTDVPSARPEQLPPVQRPNMGVPDVAPPSPPGLEQRANRENNETYVFQNGDTGDRQVFVTGPRPYPDRDSRYAYPDRYPDR